MPRPALARVKFVEGRMRDDPSGIGTYSHVVLVSLAAHR
jgi:hypothetical protein